MYTHRYHIFICAEMQIHTPVLVLVTLRPSGAGCRSKRCDTLNHQLTEQRDKAQHEGMTVLAARHLAKATSCKVSLTCVSTVRPPSNLCHVDRFLDDFQMISMPEPNINTDTVLPICNPSLERRLQWWTMAGLL